MRTNFPNLLLYQQQYIYIICYLNATLSLFTTNEFTVKNSFSFTDIWLALMLSRYLLTSLCKKLLRTAPTSYSPTISIVVN